VLHTAFEKSALLVFDVVRYVGLNDDVVIQDPVTLGCIDYELVYNSPPKGTLNNK
jgi:hypothetical protein